MSMVQSQRERLSQLKAKASDRYIQGDMHGIHYAVSIFIATAILWICVHEMAQKNPIWAISSMVATSDPLMKNALTFFRARITQCAVGCAVGAPVHRHRRFAASHAAAGDGGHSPADKLRGPHSDDVAAGADHGCVRHLCRHRVSLAHATAFRQASFRMSEVLFGCVVGLAVAWLVSVVWPLPEPQAKWSSCSSAVRFNPLR